MLHKQLHSNPVAAALLCQDGQVVRSIDGGSGWTNASRVAGAVALAWNSPELGWLLDTGGDLCPGLQALRTVDGGVTWQEGGCVGTSQQAASSGRPALDFADPQNGMALVGTETFVTADGGVTWQAA